jgi:heptaprenyl diphosphate synthase
MRTADQMGFEHLQGDLARAQRVIDQTVAVDDPTISELCLRLTRNPGRLFRPTLLLTSSYLFAEDGPADEPVIAGAALVELLHIATLYHDDICDRAETRRGLPTVNATHGDQVALLCGDYLLAGCSRLAATLGPAAMQLFGDALAGLAHGQLLETLQTGDLSRTEAGYLASIRGKTATLMSTSSALGAVLAGAEDQQAIMYAYGENLGMAFQIWDDISDLWPARDTGKATYSDLRNRIHSLPVILGLQQHPRELLALLRTDPLSFEQSAIVAGRLEAWGVRRQSTDRAAAHLQAAFAALDALDPGPHSRVPRLLAVAHAGMPEVQALLADVKSREAVG